MMNCRLTLDLAESDVLATSDSPQDSHVNYSYRKDVKMAKETDMRVCEKYALTVAEAAVYFGIGEKKLRSMIDDYSHLGLFLENGVKKMIKRKKFEDFLDEAFAI